MIFEKVLDTINTHNLIENGDKIILGISGGPDSVCLLHILNRLKETFDIKIYAAHLNHQIRGLEAQKDALYVAKLCEEMGVKYFVRSIDVPKYCEENKVSIEDGARTLRYELFYEIMQKTNANKIAIAHNMNDQAETILMHIMRGTGLQGLRGIEYIRDNVIIRPILDIERSEIEDYCEKYNLNPRIDKTNLDPIYTRNKVRLKLIPYMQENFNSNVIKSIVRMSSSLRNDSDYIEENALMKFEEICTVLDESVEIPVDLFVNLHNAIKYRIIRYAIKYILGDTNFIDQRHLLDIIELESEKKVGKKLNIPRGLFVYRKKNSIIITAKELITKEIDFSYNVPRNGFVKIKELDILVETETMSIEKYNLVKQENKKNRWFDISKLDGDIIVRSRQSGDKINLSIGNKKLKSLFIDMKIPKEERCKIPILVNNQEVMCVGTYRMSEKFKVDESTKDVLKICFKKL